MARKLTPGQKAAQERARHREALAKAEESRKRAAAARKGWKKRKAAERAKKRAVEVRALCLAVFRPKKADPSVWPGRDVLARVLARIEPAFKAVTESMPGFAGAFAPALYKGAWRAEVPFVRGLTYAETMTFLDTVTLDGVDLSGGRLHFGVVVVVGGSAGYAPISYAFANPEEAITMAVDSLAKGLGKYAPPVPEEEEDEDEEETDTRREQREKAVRLAFKRRQERERFARRTVRTVKLQKKAAKKAAKKAPKKAAKKAPKKAAKKAAKKARR